MSGVRTWTGPRLPPRTPLGWFLGCRLSRGTVCGAQFRGQGPTWADCSRGSECSTLPAPRSAGRWPRAGLREGVSSVTRGGSCAQPCPHVRSSQECGVPARGLPPLARGQAHGSRTTFVTCPACPHTSHEEPPAATILPQPPRGSCPPGPFAMSHSTGQVRLSSLGPWTGEPSGFMPPAPSPRLPTRLPRPIPTGSLSEGECGRPRPRPESGG